MLVLVRGLARVGRPLFAKKTTRVKMTMSVRGVTAVLENAKRYDDVFACFSYGDEVF
jgi:hypothetical protein